MKTAKLIAAERFETVNFHVPAHLHNHTVIENGEERHGMLVYKGAVFFEVGSEVFVSFVKKSTALWQLVREAEPGMEFAVKSFKRGEYRPADEHSDLDRTVVTYVKLAE